MQIDLVYVHPACSSAVPRFGVETGTFVYVLCTCALLVVLFAKKVWHLARTAVASRCGSGGAMAAPRMSSMERREMLKSGSLSRWRHSARSFCFTSLAVLYAPAMNFAFRTLLCSVVEKKGRYVLYLCLIRFPTSEFVLILAPACGVPAWTPPRWSGRQKRLAW